MSPPPKIGNHAAGLALAAREAGIPAHIVMPTISAAPKIAATKGYGARVVFSGPTSKEREAVAEQVMRDTGARFVPPFDHPDIVLGQGTMGLEFQAQVEEALMGAAAAAAAEGNGEDGPTGGEKKRRKGLDAIITPCGGGGMLSGVALSCEGTGISVFGAEPEFQVSSPTTPKSIVYAPWAMTCRACAKTLSYTSLAAPRNHHAHVFLHSPAETNFFYPPSNLPTYPTTIPPHKPR